MYLRSSCQVPHTIISSAIPKSSSNVPLWSIKKGKYVKFFKNVTKKKKSCSYNIWIASFNFMQRLYITLIATVGSLLAR